MPVDVVLEIVKGDVKELAPLQPYGLQLVQPQRFDANTVVHAMISLTSIVVPAVASVMIALIRSRRHVKLIANGVEIQGISESNLLQILEHLSNR